MADNRRSRDAACINQSLQNSDYAPGVDAEATCRNQAEAAENQAGSSGRFGTEFASVDNKTNRKIF
ncbi:hypothetical protein [Bacillus sp. CECT 9360]|uniref:hypothetical protein n=1 Tax=Bacillus sp. CECT 9360 TaxID=2845821 RepID=UPI001E2BA024|nr:hypothetical protein [Bacillus sp. CECT 9360]CAH0345414.1 hypothetical protein BCI9360_01700 [Bacillus sp. CECT 9360]